MKLEICCFVLRGQMTRMVWRPRIMVPSHRIMAKAILQAGREHLHDAYPGEDVTGSRAIQLFQFATGAARLSDEAAADLYQLVAKALREEGLMP
jgi:hypothetical protein